MPPNEPLRRRWFMPRRTGAMPLMALSALALLLGLNSAIAGALDIAVAGQEVVLFDQREDACDAHHHPDAPARAFRDAAGRLVLFAPNFHNRAFEGRDLRSLTADCTLRFKAAGAPRPDLLDDRTWLHAFHTEDGRAVFALASASFIPYRHGQRCAAGDDRTDCWLNGLVALSSDDGGRSFAYMGNPPDHVVFPPPGPYDLAVADPPGFISATNFVASAGHVYTIIWRRGDDWENSYNCLARAPSDALTEWSVWTGDSFAPAATFEGNQWRVHRTDCARIGPRGLSAIRGLVLHEPSGTFVAVYQHRRRDAQGELQHGIFYSTSRDLIEWSMPALLLPERLRSDAAEDESYVSYPSIVDDRSPDRNLGTIGDTADLLFVRIVPNHDNGEIRRTRQLVAVPISLSRAGN